MKARTNCSLILWWYYRLTSALVLASFAFSPAIAQISNPNAPGCVSKVDPRATAFFKRAWELNNSHQYRSALEYAEMAIGRDKNFGAAYILRGIILSTLEQHKPALESMKKGMILMPQCNDYLAYNCLGDLLQEIGDDKAALATYSRGIASNNGVVLLNARACLYMKMGQPLKALADCDLAIKRKPEAEITYGTRAMLNLQMGQFAKALPDCELVVRMVPNEAASYAQLAKALKGLGRNKEAEEAVRKANAMGSTEFAF
jgi:tetratricopeptide (TPR) repeat protein